MPRKRNDDLHQAVALVDKHYADNDEDSVSDESSEGWSTNHGNDSSDMILESAGDESSSEEESEESSEPESDESSEEGSSDEEEEDDDDDDDENEDEDEGNSRSSENSSSEASEKKAQSSEEESEEEESSSSDESEMASEAKSSTETNSDQTDDANSQASNEVDWKAEKEQRGNLLQKSEQKQTYDIDNPPEFRTLSPILHANANRQLPSDSPSSPCTELTPVILPDSEATPVEGLIRLESPKPLRSKRHTSRTAKKTRRPPSDRASVSKQNKVKTKETKRSHSRGDHSSDAPLEVSDDKSARAGKLYPRPDSCQKTTTPIRRVSVNNSQGAAKHLRRLSAASNQSGSSRAQSVSSAGGRRSSKRLASPLKKTLDTSSNHSRNSGTIEQERLLLSAPPSKKVTGSPTKRGGSPTQGHPPSFITLDKSPKSYKNVDKRGSDKRGRKKVKGASPKRAKRVEPPLVALEDNSNGSNDDCRSERSLKSRSKRSGPRSRQKIPPGVALNDSDNSDSPGDKSRTRRRKLALQNDDEDPSRRDENDHNNDDPEFDITEVDDDGGEEDPYKQSPETRPEQCPPKTPPEYKKGRKKPQKSLGVCLALLFILVVILMFCIAVWSIFRSAQQRDRNDSLPLPERNQVDSPSPAPTKAVECNGYANLCNIRISKQLFVTVNPLSLEVDAPLLRRRTQGKSSGLRERQFAEEALSLGYKSLEIKLSYCGGEVRLGNCEDWLQPHFFLTEVDRHLDRNPNDFLFIIVDADPSIPLDRISTILTDSKELTSKLYYHFGTHHPWPTLQSLFSLRRQATVIVKTRREACISCSPPLNLWADLIDESFVDFGKLNADAASFCPAFVKSNPSSLVAMSTTNVCNGSMTAYLLLDLRLGACRGKQLEPTFLSNPSITHCQNLLDAAKESNMGLAAKDTIGVQSTVRLVGMTTPLDLRSRMQFEEECRAVIANSRTSAAEIDCTVLSMTVGESSDQEIVLEISEEATDDPLSVENVEAIIRQNSQAWALSLQNPFTGGSFLSMTDILVVSKSTDQTGNQLLPGGGNAPTGAPGMQTSSPTQGSTGGGISLGDWLADSPTNPTPSLNRDALKEELISLLGDDRFGNQDNPYSKALDWIVEDDLMSLEDTSPTLIQRYAAAYFYFATTRAKPWTSCGPPTTGEDPVQCVYKYQAAAQILELPAKRWLSEKSECEWVGVTCNSRGIIFKIDLSGMQMNGWFPGGLSLLPDLETLKMINGAIAGPLLPSMFTSFNKLKVLDVTNNNLNGPLPETISSARNLQLLMLSGNDISGNIPTTFSNPTITTIDVSNNRIQGTIPSEFFGCTSLQTLNLSGNQITGSLSPAIEGLPMLGELIISENNFSGFLPVELYTLTNLKHLDISFNKFAGSLNALLGQLVNLTHLRIQNNVLRGAVPVAILNLVNLREAILSGNTFFGEIPVEMCALRSPFGLRTLQADCSKVDGLPEVACECCNVCCDADGENCVAQ